MSSHAVLVGSDSLTQTPMLKKLLAVPVVRLATCTASCCRASATACSTCGSKHGSFLPTARTNFGVNLPCTCQVSAVWVLLLRSAQLCAHLI